MRISLRIIAAFAAAGAISASSAFGAPDAKVASGETQVVARAGGREITLSELRAEMARLGLSPTAPESERAALDSLVNRIVLSTAAREAELHRRPDAIAAMRAAQDQALADLYLAAATQPAEPTRREIEDYITANPSLFAERHTYEFDVMTLPTQVFDQGELTPLFDDSADFEALESALGNAETEYRLTTVIQPGTAFPGPIREQLAEYGPGDNIVIRGEAQTQIMKIRRAERDATPSSEWPPLARRLLIEESRAGRARSLITRLKSDAAVAYYRKSAAPAPPARP